MRFVPKGFWTPLILLVSLALVSVSCAREQSADLVLRGGRVLTMSITQPEAEAVAVRGDRILAVGTIAEIEPYLGPRTRVIELSGELVIPGFIEGHGHLVSLGQSKRRLDLMGAKNFDEIVGQVAEAAKGARPGEWITGRGWHQEKWDRPLDRHVKGFPYHDALSAVSPENPVLLTHASGHASLANAKAMELAAITRATPDPPGGELVRDRNGELIGVFRENGSDLIEVALERDLARRTPEEVETDLRAAIAAAVSECLAKGITTFQDAGSSFETIDLFKKLVAEQALPIRLWVMVRDDIRSLAENLAGYRVVGMADHRLTVRAIKMSIDGALGSRGAWLLEPYADLRSSSGLNTTPVAVIEEAARLALEHDYQLCVHAIGDRANREMLDLYEQAFKADTAGHDRRWRIEHVQHLAPSDIPRFGSLGVIASMQGIHCTSDGPWVPARIGNRRAEEGAYVWRKLFESGALIVNGTDAPVEDVSPIQCYHASVTRKMKNGEAFYSEQNMTRLEALRTYTVNAAFAGFEEEIKGTLEPGKLADITVLSQDITTVAQDKILDTRVVYTIVGGKVAYEGTSLASR